MASPSSNPNLKHAPGKEPVDDIAPTNFESGSEGDSRSPKAPTPEGPSSREWEWYPALLNRYVETKYVPDQVPPIRDSWERTFAGFVSFVQDEFTELNHDCRQLETLFKWQWTMNNRYYAMEQQINQLTTRVEQQQQQIQALLAPQEPEEEEEDPEEEPEEEEENDLMDEDGAESDISSDHGSD